VGNSVEEEQALVRRARAGDRDAFGILVRLSYDRVFRVALRIVRNREDAAEICQETFVRAVQSINRFEPGRPVFPWLYQICRNLSLNRIQRLRAREGSLPEFDLGDSRTRTPEEDAVRAESSDAVRRAIEALPDHYRKIIMLSHFDECTYEEMSQILSVPIGTVMSRLYNARKKLRTLLAAEEDNDGRAENSR
jgi:RNA polymerase sigma-70 factor (ECF subfamily)